MAAKVTVRAAPPQPPQDCEWANLVAIRSEHSRTADKRRSPGDGDEVGTCTHIAVIDIEIEDFDDDGELARSPLYLLLCRHHAKQLADQIKDCL